MATTNDDYSQQVGSGQLVQLHAGAELAVVAGAIAITDSYHVLTGAGTITTINFAAANTPVVPCAIFLVRKAGATCVFAAGGNIGGDIPSIADDDPIIALWDGSSKWTLLAGAILSGYLKADGTVVGATSQVQVLRNSLSVLRQLVGNASLLAQGGSGGGAYDGSGQLWLTSLLDLSPAHYRGWLLTSDTIGSSPGDGTLVLAQANRPAGATILTPVLSIDPTTFFSTFVYSLIVSVTGATDAIKGTAVTGIGIRGEASGAGKAAQFTGGTDNAIGAVQIIRRADAAIEFAIMQGATKNLYATGDGQFYAKTLSSGSSKYTGGIAGSPEGALIGSPGDIASRVDGAHDSTGYIKESGVGTNTGWMSFATLSPTLTMGLGRAADSVVRLALQQDANGPVLALDNTARPNYIHFTKSSTTGAVDIGFLGSTEANLCYNMNYSTGVHKYYDSAQNAMWMAINGTGFYLQFAPSGYGGTDIWSGQGSQIPFQLDGATGNSTQTGTNTSTGVRISSGSGCTGSESALHTWAGNGETIVTAGVGTARNTANGAARTGAILAVGTYAGQEVTVFNEDGTAGNSITFAAAGTSHVANGVTSVINGLQCRKFTWNVGTSLWYENK